MTVKEKIRKYMTDPLRLSPPEGGRYGPYCLHVIGNGNAELSGCLSLTEYSEDRITFRVRRGFVTIEGKDLTLRSYGPGKVAVCGELRRIDFLREDGAEGSHV